ncbi:hypothetical protein ACFE04_012544 [Oxalis oulophora]
MRPCQILGLGLIQVQIQANEASNFEANFVTQASPNIFLPFIIPKPKCLWSSRQPAFFKESRTDGLTEMHMKRITKNIDKLISYSTHGTNKTGTKGIKKKSTAHIADLQSKRIKKGSALNI